MRAAILLLPFALAGCDAKTATADAAPAEVVRPKIIDAGADDDSRDLYALQVDTSGIRGGRTYADFDDLRDTESAESFKGFGCLDSCNGHEAGYAWAKKAEVGDPSDCRGNSWSFTEGCVAEAMEYDDGYRDRDDRDLGL